MPQRNVYAVFVWDFPPLGNPVSVGQTKHALVPARSTREMAVTWPGFSVMFVVLVCLGGLPVRAGVGPREDGYGEQDAGNASAAARPSNGTRLSAAKLAALQTQHTVASAKFADSWHLTPEQAAAVGDPSLAGKIRICVNPETPYVSVGLGSDQSALHPRPPHHTMYSSVTHCYSCCQAGFAWMHRCMEGMLCLLSNTRKHGCRSCPVTDATQTRTQAGHHATLVNDPTPSHARRPFATRPTPPRCSRASSPSCSGTSAAACRGCPTSRSGRSSA